MRYKFERYVNFEFYKTPIPVIAAPNMFERYVNFEFYKTDNKLDFTFVLFERYVNFEFYKTSISEHATYFSLRDM